MPVRDSFYWALYCSDSTMEAVRATEERRVKYELRTRSSSVGLYQRRILRRLLLLSPFFFREHIKNASNPQQYSMGNAFSARQRQPRPSI